MIDTIGDIEKRIKGYKRALKMQEEEFDNAENGLRKGDLRKIIVVTKKKIIRLEQQAEKMKLDKMKEKLGKKTKVGKEILKDIDNYDNASKTYKLWQDAELDAELSDIDGRDDIQELRERVSDLFKAFVRAFNKYLDETSMNKPFGKHFEPESISFGESDLQEAFDFISETVEKLPTSYEFSEDVAKEYMPKKDIQDIIKLGDIDGVDKLHEQLCMLYGYDEPGKYEIYAIHGYDHTTYGEGFGKSAKIFMKESYDKELGETTVLYVFNKKTGELEALGDSLWENDYDSDIENENAYPRTVSRGKMLEMRSLDRKDVYTEVDTLDCAGLKLSFYRDSSGNLRMARNREGVLDEMTESHTLDEVKWMREAKKNIQSLNFENEVRSTEVRNTKTQNVDVHGAEVRRTESKAYDDFWREQLWENALDMDLDSKEEAASHEKLDREHLESRRRLL